MITEIRIPSPGESITEVELATWLVEDGAYVEKDQEIAEVESDKATLPLIAEESGILKTLVNEGSTVKVGDVVCEIDNSKKQPKENEASEKKSKKIEVVEKEIQAKEKSSGDEKVEKSTTDDHIKVTPVAEKMMKENNMNVDDIINGLRRITANDVKSVLSQSFPKLNENVYLKTRDEDRNPMSKLRKKLGERLVSVKNETAMLTTFNEVNMGRIIEIRKKHQKAFVEKHGIKLGFMSFFTKAVVEALKQFPNVNSRIESQDIITPKFYDIGIAVQTDKGLTVPVLRNVETMTLADIERGIGEMAQKARSNRLSIEEMAGGSFTITNGGVFGSLLSTPIINPPQSAILGMHNIIERPIAVNGKVEIHPMMYVALSYDHRLIDGRDSVSFLVKVKELLESPEIILFGGKNPENLLLDI